MKTTENSISDPRKDLLEADRIFLETESLRAITERYPTPFFLFDEKRLRTNAKSLQALFSFHQNTVHSFPVRRCPNAEVLRILREESIRVRCETPAELRMAVRCGFRGPQIVYAAMHLPRWIAVLLRDLDAVLQVYSPLPLPDVLPRRVDLVCAERELHNLSLLPVMLKKTRIGLTTDEMAERIPLLRAAGVESFGLVLHSDSNNVDENVLAAKLLSLHREAQILRELTGADFERFDLTGGLGMQFNKSVKPVDAELAAEKFRAALETLDDVSQELDFCLERRLVDSAAVFVTSVLGVYERGNPTIVVDADARQIVFNTLNRYRHISVAGKEERLGRKFFDVVGIRGINTDWLGENRVLQGTEPGDLLIFHDVGGSIPARPEAECLLLRENGQVVCLQHGEE